MDLIKYKIGFIEKLREEAYKSRWHKPTQTGTWTDAFLETIFRTEQRPIPGKGPMDMLHPDIKKLHLPHGMYLADWRKYRVEDHPELVNFQKKCHLAGLHDPWLRNHAFKFYPHMRSDRSIMTFMLRGIGTGFLIALAIYLPCKYLLPDVEDKYSSHGSHHGHHEGH